MSDRIIVLVSDLDNTIHGEINVLDGPEQATRFVEQLIESGFEQDRIRVFFGDEVQMEVHHRPVVSLGAPTRTNEEVAPQTEPADDTAAEQQEEAPQPTTARAKSHQIEEVGGEPFVKNGVRFSTLFRPA